MFEPRVMEVLNDLVAKHSYPLLFATISGAHLYGFESPDSDYDLRGAHVTPATDIAGLNPPEETITTSEFVDWIEADVVSHEIRKFMLQMLAPNGYILEQLFSPIVIQSSPFHEELKEVGKACITKRHTQHYEGFARGEWGRFAREGTSLKSLLYVYRVILTGIHLMRSGEMLCHLPTLAQEYEQEHLFELIEAKRSGSEKAELQTLDVPRHEELLSKIYSRIAVERDASHLPEESDARSALADLLTRIRS